MDLFQTPRFKIEETVFGIIPDADSTLFADFTLCMIEIDRDLWVRRMLENDIPHRVNEHQPNAFTSIILACEPTPEELKMEELDSEEKIPKSDYRPATRFIKILKSLALKSDVTIDDAMINTLIVSYDHVADAQTMISGNLLNIHYVIYKMLQLFDDVDDAEKIRSLIRIPEGNKLVQYDLKWKRIVENIGWLVYEPTLTFKFNREHYDYQRKHARHVVDLEKLLL